MKSKTEKAIAALRAKDRATLEGSFRAIAEALVTPEVEKIWQQWLDEARELTRYASDEYLACPRSIQIQLSENTTTVETSWDPYEAGTMEQLPAQLRLGSQALLKIVYHKSYGTLWISHYLNIENYPFIPFLESLLVCAPKGSSTDPLWYLTQLAKVVSGLKECFAKTLANKHRNLDLYQQNDWMTMRFLYYNHLQTENSCKEIIEQCRKFPKPSPSMKAIREIAEKGLGLHGGFAHHWWVHPDD